MKKILLTIIVAAAACISVAAQPKSFGLRIGADGIDADYIHTISSDRFIEGNLGVDFGFEANGNAGIKATGIFNFVWARPAWTDKGKWALYAGPGITLGYVDDSVPYDILNMRYNYFDNGFMIGLVGQVGIEYSFTFPLEIALDLRPCVGMHINDGSFRIPYTDQIVDYESKIGFYDNGLFGMYPSVSIRYRF